jgi:cysteine desulfurase
MLGFKLELPQREDGITKKARPIYLDMQVKTLHHVG